MKTRIFALVLALCMMMGMVAFAAQNTVLQDEQPPKVVTYVNDAGETIVARICDAEGNTIAEIKDDGSLILTDVHARQNAENGVVVTRLTGAYEGIMGDVHYSNVACKLHDHQVKVDVDEALAGMGDDIDSHDLVMYELFDVMLSDEAMALLTEGNYLEVTFEITEEHESLPLMALFTDDGIKWMVLPTTTAGENRFTVQLPGGGTVSLLNDGRESMGIGESIQRVEIEIPGDEAGEENSNFTPSVSGKTAPQMETFTGEDGEVYVAYIRNNEGSAEIPVPAKNYIQVTAVAESGYIADIQTYEHLEWGYESILEVENVGELYAEHNANEGMPEQEHQTLAAALDETLTQMGLNLTHDQLVVRDLFEVSAYGEYLDYLYNDDFYLEVVFKANLDPSKPLVVIHSPDSKHWHVHSADEFVVNADGTLTLKMYDLGVVAFLVEAEEELNPETAVQSPN